MFAAKANKTDLLGDIRQIKEGKEHGAAAVEKLFEARGSKTGAMAQIRYVILKWGLDEFSDMWIYSQKLFSKFDTLID